MILNWPDYSIHVQHKDCQEKKFNLLILKNENFKVKFSWKSFKEFNHVLDVSKPTHGSRRAHQPFKNLPVNKM